MAKKNSAGMLMYRIINNQQFEVLLVHPGGPFWAKKDAGAWFIPKGEIAQGEDAFAAAKREFQEETGLTPEGPFADLGEVKHKSGKIVRAWAFEGTCDPATVRSNTFLIEWPPKSGRQASFPEIDKAQFFGAVEAREKILPAELPFVERLHALHDLPVPHA